VSGHNPLGQKPPPPTLLLCSELSSVRYSSLLTLLMHNTRITRHDMA